MNAIGKTFRIKKEHLQKWVAALRSGEYKQSKGALKDDTTGGYCCLGLLQQLLDGEVERFTPEDIAKGFYGSAKAGDSKGLPGGQWMKKYGVYHLCNGKPQHTNIADGDSFNPSLCLLHDGLTLVASQANDGMLGLSKSKPFPEIADLLEQVAETY